MKNDIGARSLRAVALLTCVLLASCGYGPLGTCRTQCKAPEVRDAFCGCYKPTPPGPGSSNPVSAPPNYGAPYLNFTWAESQSCGSINRAYYVFNPADKDLELWVSRRQRSGARVGSWVKAAKFTTTFESATYIGLEGLEPDCFDQDFQPGTFRNALTKIDGYIEHAALTSGQSVQSLLQDRKEIIFVKKAITLDCAALYTSTPASASCLSLAPSDLSAADQARINVVNGINSGNIDWNIALAPITGNSPECRRSETVLIQGRIISQGDACAYPFSANIGDPNPSVVVHVPARLTADVPAVAKDKRIASRTIGEAPFLAFKSKTVTEDYGGYIESVTANDRSIFYTTSAPACIAVTTR